jgi:hypothetical protein
MRSVVVSVGGFYALCLTLVLGVPSLQAVDYYVSTSGSDSNPGTQSQPFRTITYAYFKVVSAEN